MEQSPSWEADRFELVKQFLHFMTPQVLFPRSHVLSSGLYREPQESTLYPPILFKIHFYIVILFISASREWSSIGFLTKAPYGFLFSTILATCSAALFLHHNWQEYKSWSFSLSSFHQPSLTYFIQYTIYKTLWQRFLYCIFYLPFNDHIFISLMMVYI